MRKASMCVTVLTLLPLCGSGAMADIFRSAAAGDVNGVRQHLDAGVSPDRGDWAEERPLHPWRANEACAQVERVDGPSVACRR